jgi:phosphopantetheine adenylyltransferase
LVQKRNNDFKAKCTFRLISDKMDMKKKEEHLSILKEQYERVQEIYLNKIKTLEEHLSKLNDRYNDLTRKSKRESESLRSQLKVYLFYHMQDGTSRGEGTPRKDET